MFRDCCGSVCVTVHLLCVVSSVCVALRGLSGSIGFSFLFSMQRSFAAVVPTVIPFLRVGGGVSRVSQTLGIPLLHQRGPFMVSARSLLV